jgi:hypothetical protein
MNKFRDVVYDMKTIINYSVFCTEILLREILGSLYTHTHTEVTMEGNEYINSFDYSDDFTDYMYTTISCCTP